MARLIPIDCEADSSFTSQRYYHRTADAEWLMSPIERPTFLLSISPRWRGDRYRHAGACDASYHVAFSTDYSYLVSQLSSYTDPDSVPHSFPLRSSALLFFSLLNRTN